jgi:DNA-binding NtrC family response regulator
MVGTDYERLRMSKTGIKLGILYCESDEELLSQQAAAFTQAGHRIVQALGRKVAEDALRKETFDLVLLGATLSKNDRHHLPYMIRKANQSTLILVAHTGGHHHEVDGTVDGFRGTGAILEKIASMAPAKASAAGAH